MLRMAVIFRVTGKVPKFFEVYSVGELLSGGDKRCFNIFVCLYCCLPSHTILSYGIQSTDLWVSLT